MASDNNYQPVVWDDHPTAEPGEKKVIEERETNKPEKLEIPVTKSEETSEDKRTEVSLIAAEVNAKDAGSSVSEEPLAKSAIEASENLPEEKPATEAFENVLDVKPAVEIIQENKPAVEAIEKLPEEKPATEAVSRSVEPQDVSFAENVESEVKKDEGTKPDEIESSLATNEKNEKTEVPIKSAEVAEKSLDGEVIEKKEDLLLEVENKNDKDVAEATGNVKAAAEEITKKADTNVEGTKEAVVDDKTSDTQPKEGDDTKTSKDDIPAAEVSAKPPQRSSWNFLSKMKQSLGKVKKAIAGKSPSSKTLQPEDKDDEKVN